MRLVFAGTPEFAAHALDAILRAGHEVVGVLAQPDRPAGRGMRLLPGAVKQRALDADLPVAQPLSLRDAEAQRALAGWFGSGYADVMVVAAYGLLLPPAVLAMPRLGCLNIHASLLPRWRGAAPIERAIIAGDATTGVCIMQMDAGLDTGQLLLQRTTSILERDTALTLRERLAGMGAEAMVETLNALQRGDTLAAQAQATEGVTYAGKIAKADAALDFSQSALELDRKIRAFDPVPGAFANLRGDAIKMWSALSQTHAAPALPPGTVRSCDGGNLLLACGADGRDTLLVEELQKPGGKRLRAAQFLQGFALSAGDRFEHAAQV
jgi:methionyl-tRNA formyltransferase